MSDFDTVIVGAGVSGLACAITLKEGGQRVLLIEAANEVGGRVKTDEFEGFALDRGFQVLLSAYPCVSEFLDLEALETGSFDSGALLGLPDETYSVSDPIRQPDKLFETAKAPIGKLSDKMRILKLRSDLVGMSEEAVWELDNITTYLFLKQRGFSNKIIDLFFRPFFAGIFLEDQLETSARMFAYVYRYFSLGLAMLPRGGMGAVPRQMMKRLGEENIRCETEVQDVTKGYVTLPNGSRVKAKHVVVATDGDQAGKWFPELPDTKWTGGFCHYFAATESPFKDRKKLFLNATGRGLVNHIAVPSDVAAGYAPDGQVLISANTVGLNAEYADPLRIKNDLEGLIGAAVGEWRHLKTIKMSKSLPRMHPEDVYARSQNQLREIKGVHICGDYFLCGSLDAAISSGVQTARRLLNQ